MMKIKKDGKKGYIFSEDTPRFVDIRKRTVVIQGCRMKEEFSIETEEGTMIGKSGDWLLRGIADELYPCDADIFDKSHDIC